MNELTVTVMPDAPKAGENITLTAQMEHGLTLESWEWKRKEKGSSRSIPLAGQASNICTDSAVAGEWTYEASAKDSNGKQLNGTADVNVASDEQEVATPPLSWKPSFAWTVGFALLVVLGVFVWWGAFSISPSASGRRYSRQILVRLSRRRSSVPSSRQLPCFC